MSDFIILSALSQQIISFHFISDITITLGSMCQRGHFSSPEHPSSGLGVPVRATCPHLSVYTHSNLLEVLWHMVDEMLSTGENLMKDHACQLSFLQRCLSLIRLSFSLCFSLVSRVKRSTWEEWLCIPGILPHPSLCAYFWFKRRGLDYIRVLY